MKELFQAGGFPMWFVLAFGAISLVAAGFFAARPALEKVNAIKALSVATAFSVVGATMGDIASVCYHVPANPEWSASPRMPLIVMEGIGESMSPGLLGFTLLSLTWMVMAVGHRRLAQAVA